MTTEIGLVKALIGTATATAVDGSQRNLLVGDRVYADEIITTGATSAIEIEFSDGSLMDLGRNSQAFLDTDIFDPQQTIVTDIDVEVAALQDALVSGEDPTQQGDAPAAGAESEGNEGVTTVAIEREDLTVEVTSGFETSTAAASSFLDDSDLFSGINDSTSDIAELPPIITPPTTTPISTQSNNDSDVINFNVSGSFSGSGLTFSAVGLPSNLSINPVTGIISGTLDSSASQAGPYSATIIATDTASNSVSQSFAWNVANPAPEADNDSASLNEDSFYNGSVASNDNDPDGDLVTFSLNTSVANGTLVFNNDGSYRYTPTADFNGTDTFSYTITDADGSTDTATATITITGTNDVPVIQPEPDFDAVEDAAIITGQVIASDIDSDDDSASLTYSIDGITPAGLTFNANGSYSFDPSHAAYQSLAVGETTTASFSWKATDSHGADSAVDAVTITITGTNDQPVVSDVGTQGITGAIVLNGALTTSVDYWNFTHNGGDLSIDMLTEISGPNGQNGINGVGYNEIDGDNSQTSLDVMIRVFSLNADGSRGGQVGVNDNNNNPGFDGSLYNRDSLLDLNNLPQGDYQLVVGAWMLTSTEVVSGINAVDSATWHFEGPYQITLHGENGAQLKAQGIAFEAVDGDTLFENVLPTVVDADLTDTHDYSLVAASETLSQSNPLGAPLAMPTITVNADGSYSVSGDFNSLALGETATVTFQYVADDLNGFDGTDGVNESSVSAPATVTITIQGTNDAPIAFVDAAATTENATITIDVLANDTDIDNGDDQTFSLDNVSFASGVPAVPTATVSIVANQLVFDPGTDFDYLAVGESTTVIVNYTMSDDSGAASSSTATITISGTSDAPVITQALDGDTVLGTHESAVSLKIFITDLSGNIISEHDATVDPNGTWTADFVKPAVGDYKMTAVAYDGANGTGNASDPSNAININVGSRDQDIVDTDDAINIVFDGGNGYSSSSTTGAGNDMFIVNNGNDIFNAGAGNDTFIVEGTNKGFNTFNGGAGNDLIQGGVGDDNIRFTSFDANDSIEVIDGGAGTNTIVGRTHADLDFSATTLLNIDKIHDGSGANTITGNNQDLVYHVGLGTDTFNAGTGNDTFIVEGTNKSFNTFNGGTGNDLIQGSASNDTIKLTSFDVNNSIEVIDGGGGTNTIEGLTHVDLNFSSTTLLNIDKIQGGSGSNMIIGSQGDDLIDAGRGSDQITGGAGNDILTGGLHNDTFIWNSADVGVSGSPAHDQITDFEGDVTNSGVSPQDVLDLSDLLGDSSHVIEGLVEDDASGSGQHLQLSITDVATNTVVQTIDLNNVAVNAGDSTADMLNNLLANGGINDGF